MGFMYEQFFPKWNHYYTVILQQNCSSELLLYRTSPAGSPAQNAACIDTALCMMDNTVKNVETQAASTGILLGLMPSVLSLLGSGPVELSLLSTRRPLLSLLLALGAPVVNPMRLFEHINPEEIVKESQTEDEKENENETSRENRTDSSEGFNVAADNPNSDRIITVLQYAFALAAVINIVFVSIELDTKAYSVVLACKWRSQIYLWTFSAAILQVLSWIALRTRAQFHTLDGETKHLQLKTRLRRWIGNEFSRCSQHQQRQFHWGLENKWYLFLTQILAVGTVVHIFYGTAILSTYQFLAPINAVVLIVRYILSAWVCRAILNFELSGLSSRTRIISANESHTKGKVLVVSNA